MKNKKAQTLNVGFVLAIFLFLLLGVLFFGGLGKLFEIVGYLKQIPAWVWVILVVVFVFSRWGK